MEPNSFVFRTSQHRGRLALLNLYEES